MKRLTIAMSILFVIYLLTSFNSNEEGLVQGTKVYICDSDGATKYHYKKNCRGLNNCKHDIIYVTLDEAKKKGKKTLCGWED